MDLQNKTALITGGSGFLGTYVARELEQAGAKTVAVGRADYDLLQRSEVDRMLSDHRPDALVHLAGAVGGIGANQREPGRFLYENALMGLQVLEACRLAGTDKVLVVGTVCSYPSETPVPFSEDAIWAGYPEETNAPYGLAKRLILAQAQAYRRQYDMNIIYLLPANLYGPGDHFEIADSHVIPAMIRKFIEAREAGAPEVTLWGDGRPTREFLHVADAARACRLALERYDGAEAVNLGSGTEISIRELSTVIAEAVGFQGRISWDASKPNGQLRRLLDTRRARDLFGFAASTDFSEGIAETVRWYEKVADQSLEDGRLL